MRVVIVCGVDEFGWVWMWDRGNDQVKVMGSREQYGVKRFEVTGDRAS